MKKYIYYSTIFSICTEAFLIHFIIDLKLFYLIILVNFSILAITENLRISNGLLIFYGYLLFSGFVSVILGTNHITNFFAQFFGIFIISLYYYNFYKIFEERTPKILYDYVYLCFGLVLIGLPIYFIDILQGKFEGFHSLLSERTNYGALVLPAFYYSYKNKAFPRYVYQLILVSILLTGSSVVLISLGVGILLIPKRIKIVKLFALSSIVIVLFFALYYSYGNFRLRVDDTSKGIVQKDLSGVNLSTFAILSNLYITSKSFEENPILGSGLGSHELSHDKYIEEIDGISEFGNYINLNSKDANSLFLRVLSDMGLLGIVLVFSFIRKFYTKCQIDENLNFISKSILIYFFCKLFRLGHYFSPEMFFFVFGYYFSNKYFHFGAENNYKYQKSEFYKKIEE